MFLDESEDTGSGDVDIESVEILIGVVAIVAVLGLSVYVSLRVLGCIAPIDSVLGRAIRSAGTEIHSDEDTSGAEEGINW
jgi:hypothetical protein